MLVARVVVYRHLDRVRKEDGDVQQSGFVRSPLVAPGDDSVRRAIAAARAPRLLFRPSMTSVASPPPTTPSLSADVKILTTLRRHVVAIVFVVYIADVRHLAQAFHEILEAIMH